MPSIIFFVHGVGEHAEGWEKSAADELAKLSDKYSRGGKGDFAKRFRIIGTNYNALFKDILIEWAQEKKNLDSLAAEVGASLVEKLLKWIGNADDIEKDFFWTHAFDVLTYYLLPTVREAVRVRVALQWYEAIKDLKENEHWSIVGHSLGTAVVHDTLHTWYNQPLAGGGKLGDQRAPRLVQMVANCSRVLQTDFDVYESDVCPGNACNYYFSVQHPSDPVTLVRPFLPALWPKDPTMREFYYQAKLEHDYIQQKNIHDLAHYLRHPDVWIPLVRCLSYDAYVTKEGEAKYRDAFELHGKLTDPELIKLKKKFEELGITLPDKWKGFLLAWNRLKEFLDSSTSNDGVGENGNG